MKLVDNILRQIRDLTMQARGREFTPDDADLLLDDIQTFAFLVRDSVKKPPPVAELTAVASYHWRCGKCKHINVSDFMGGVPAQIDCYACKTMHKTKVMK